MILLWISVFAMVCGTVAMVAWLALARPLRAFTAGWVLLLSHVVGEALLVGAAFRQLRPGALLLCAVVVAAGEVALAARRPGAFSELAERTRGAAHDLWRGAWRHPVVGIFSLAVAVEYAWQALQAVRLPQIAWDGLSYHLVSPATWIQHGAIVHTTQTIFSDTYPQDQELVTGWVGTFLHSLRYSALTPFLFAALGFGAVAMLTRHLGARRHLAVLAGAGFLAIPALFLQVNTGYVDLSAASAGLAALAFVLASLADNDGGRDGLRGVLVYLTVAGCAAGLAAGLKATNLAIVAFVIVIGVILHGRASVASRVQAGEQSGAPPSPKPALLATGLPVLALSSFWYIRTWITYSNPFYPVSLFGFQGWGPLSKVVIGANKPQSLDHTPLGVVGAIAKSWANDLHLHQYAYDQRLGGFGMQWLLIGLPALVALAVILVRRRDWLHVLGLLLPVVLIFVASGAPWWARYTLTMAGLGCVAVGVCTQELLNTKAGAAARRGRLALRALAAAVPVAYVAAAIATMVSATNPSQLAVLNKYGDYQRATISQAAHLIRTGDRTAVFPWDQFQKLDRVMPAGATIAITANDSQQFTYPFVGPDLKRQIVRVGSPSSSRQLAAMMTAEHARYVVLDQTYLTADLMKSVTADTRHFRALITGGAINGSDIYQLGNWRLCSQRPMRITDVTRDGSVVHVTVQLGDGCGPVAGATVALWEGPQGERPWSRVSLLLATARTGPDGSATFAVPATRIASASILWTHFSGRFEPRLQRPPEASRTILAPATATASN